MQITMTVQLSERVLMFLIKGIMENFPEASAGSSMRCYGWKYAAMQFDFQDSETGTEYRLEKVALLKAVPLLFSDKWPKGCTPLPNLNVSEAKQMEALDDWLCQADAMDFDAFVQLACLGDVIYG